jgi:predicted dehydrogenase
VSARGCAFLRPGTEDVVFMHLDFREGPRAEVQMSWLDPHKERRLTVIGSKRMTAFDDALPTEKVRVYDLLSLRDGDIHIPRISTEEPLRIEIDHFVQCVETGSRPRTDATAGFRIVRILAAAEASCANSNAQVASP